MSLAVGYLDTEFGTFRTFDVVTGQIADLTGSPLAKAPEWSVTVGAQYDYMLANQWRIVPNLAFTYRSSRTDVAVDFKSSGEGLNVQVYANNLEDDAVWTNGGINAAGVRVPNARPPLMYGVRLRYSFGK